LKVPLAFANSSIGKKWIVALTGLVMFGFVIGHLIGNLQFFVGPKRSTIMASSCAPRLSYSGLFGVPADRAAPARRVYTLGGGREPQGSTAKVHQTSLGTGETIDAVDGDLGMLLLAFIIFHLAHFTAQNVDPSYAGFHDEKGRHDIFRMMFAGFSNPLYSGFYAVAMVFLCSHLSHGAWSWMQTVGLRTKKIADPLHVARASSRYCSRLGIFPSLPLCCSAALEKATWRSESAPNRPAARNRNRESIFLPPLRRRFAVALHAECKRPASARPQPRNLGSSESTAAASGA
jgi:succinate dehydrogenase / fumarate reductase cytochrome b subunit